jgi:hypothetical protein
MKLNTYLYLFTFIIFTNFSFSQSWVSTTLPTTNQLNISRTSNIEITFNRAMLGTSFNSGNVVVSGFYKGIYITGLSYNSAARKLTITHSQPFMIGDYINVTLGATIKDSANNSMPKGYNYSFNSAVNGGKGTFSASGSAIVTGGNPYKIVSGDFYKDGNIDLAVMGETSLTILKNDGAGNFTTISTYTGFSSGVDMFAEDVDNDGNLDLIISDQWVNTIQVLKNNGYGVFSLLSTFYAGGDRTQHIAVANLDNDAYPDIICANWSSNTVSLFKNNGAGTFTLMNTISGLGTRPMAMGAGDFDGDGLVDLMVGIDWSPALVVALKNQGNYVFTTNQTITVRDRPYSIVASDYNGDGKLDFCVANFYDNTLSMLTNSGSGYFYPTFISTGGNGARFLSQGDYDHNGAIDFSIGSALANILSVIKNDGTGIFSGLVYGNTFGTPGCVTSGDFDNDGDLDIAAANQNSGTVSIFKNDNSIGITPLGNNMPADYRLGQNYPNPFNPTTNFRFSLIRPDHVMIKLYDSRGQEISTLYNGYRTAGEYEISVDASELGMTSGIYFYSIQTNEFSDTKKMILLK